MTVSDLLRALKRHWLLEIILFLLVIGVVAGKTYTTPPMYTTSAQLMAKNSDGAMTTGASNGGSSPLASYAQLVQSDAVLEPVVNNLGLHTSVAGLRGNVSASASDGSAFVSMTVTYSDPNDTVTILNEVVKQLNKQITSDGSSGIQLSFIQKPYVPSSPSSPNVKGNMMMGAFAALIIAAAGAVIREMSDNSIHTKAEIQSIVPAPILAAVPKSPTLAGRTPAVIVKPRGHAAEEFRRLITNLSFVKNDRGNRGNVLVVTSAMPGEGKTTVSVNIAATFVEKGESVLLIDADVRHPSVAKALGISNGVGLMQMLTNQVDAQTAVQQYWKPEFQVLPVEDNQGTAAVMLSSAVMENMIDQAAKHYDHVIIDTAPMQVSNDASLFAREGATLLLVVAQTVGRKKVLRDVAHEFKVSRVKISGVAFNRVAHERSRKGNYYYYEESETKAKKASKRSSRKASASAPATQARPQVQVQAPRSARTAVSGK